MELGKRITLEGLAPNHGELLKRLHAELVAQGIPVAFLPPSRESTDSTTEAITTIISDAAYPKSLRTHSLLENATVAAQYDASQAIVAAGTHCLTGHSVLSTLVADYYGMGAASDYQFLSAVTNFASNKQLGDLVIVLDTPVSNSSVTSVHDLLLPSGMTPDAAFLERMRAGYLWEAKQRKLPVVYATEDTNATFDEIWKYVAAFLQIDKQPRASHEALSVAEVLAANPLQRTPTLERPKTFASTSFGVSTPEGAQKAASENTTSLTILTDAYLQLNDAVRSGDFLHDYEAKDAAGHYRYYLPPELKGKVRSHYIRTMNQLFETYGTMVLSLKAYLAASSRPTEGAFTTLRAILPLAATAPVSFVPRHTTSYLPSSLPETTKLTHDFPDYILPATTDKLAELAADILPPNFTAEGEAVKLVDFRPRNELDLAADTLYSYTDLPMKQLREIADSWTYQQKIDALTMYCGINTNVPSAQYVFDLTTPFTALHDLLAQRIPHDIHWQTASPRLGYSIPSLIEEAGLSDQYEQCFDRSLELFSALHAAKGIEIAQYAVLQGHKIRWSYTLNAGQMQSHIQSLPSLQRSPEEFSVTQQMFEKVAEVHPLIAEAMARNSTP